MALLRDLYKKIIRLSDFNGDSLQDFFVTGRQISSGFPISFTNVSAGVLGNGSTGFLSTPLAPINSPNSSDNWFVRSASFNGDNQTDIFYYNTQTGQKAISLIGLGFGTTGTTRVIAQAFLPASPTGNNWQDWNFNLDYDFNNDRNSDVFWTNSTTGQIAIWTISGTSITGGAVFLNSPTGSSDTAQWQARPYTDFNGDGSNDIFWSNSTTGQKAIWFMNGAQILASGFLQSSPTGLNPADWSASVAGDFNGDGKSDILWTNIRNSQQAIWLMNGASPIGGAFLPSSPTGANVGQWSASVTFDFNGDRKSDILWSNPGTGQIAIWTMDGTTITGGALREPVIV